MSIFQPRTAAAISFDDIMSKALGVPAPLGTAKNDDEPKRLSAHPRKKP